MDNIYLNYPMEYSLELIAIILEIIILLMLLMVFYNNYWQLIIGYFKRPNVPHLKEVYTKKLYNLLKRVDNREYDNRDAYFRLSKIIREFVEKSTLINVLNLSKDEIKKLNIKDLDSLMDEYYPPEFSSDYQGDIKKSINNAILTINRWE